MASLVVRLDISALRMQGRRRSPLSKLEVLNANAQKELFNQERFFDLHVRGFCGGNPYGSIPISPKGISSNPGRS